MGKGGAANYGAPAELPSKRHPAPSYERSELATTLAQPSDEITKRSLRECIPAHCFVRSYAHSLGHLAWDLAMVATAFFAVHYASGVLPFYLVPVAWLGYWWYQGLTCTGLWVLGTRAFFPPHRRPRLFSPAHPPLLSLSAAHECGHGGFTDSRLVNDAVGFVLHSALGSPYFSWAITHAKHHHYTNHMTMGETWVPSTADPSRSSVKKAKTVWGTIKRILIVATVGWYAYLIFNATGAKMNLGQSHFNPKSKPSSRRRTRITSAPRMLA